MLEVSEVIGFRAEFSVDGIPKGQPRPRAFARTIGEEVVARVYDAGTAEGWKSAIAMNSQAHRPKEPLDCPLHVRVDLFLPRPKSRSRKCDPDGPVPCVSKPDLDNLAKAVIDCLTQLGWWRDDSVITSMRLCKVWHGKGDRPGAHIVVSTEVEDVQ